MADLVQRQRRRLVGRLLLEEEAYRAARFLEVAVLGMALVARREHASQRPGIESSNQFPGTRLQGVAIVSRQEIWHHQEAIARPGGEIGLDHGQMRSMTSGRAAAGVAPILMARRTRVIA